MWSFELAPHGLGQVESLGGREDLARGMRTGFDSLDAAVLTMGAAGAIGAHFAIGSADTKAGINGGTTEQQNHTHAKENLHGARLIHQGR